jgi:hypothetical protein
MIAALKDPEVRGFVSKAAEKLGCAVKTIYNYRDKHPTVAQAMQDIKEDRTDFVESRMLSRIKEGSDTMIIFYLKTQAKDRGYIERREFTGADGKPLLIVNWDDPEDTD